MKHDHTLPALAELARGSIFALAMLVKHGGEIDAERDCVLREFEEEYRRICRAAGAEPNPVALYDGLWRHRALRVFRTTYELLGDRYDPDEAAREFERRLLEASKPIVV